MHVCGHNFVCPITRMFNHFYIIYYDCDKFKKAGQFSFSDIQKLSKNLKSDILHLRQLVKLLEHLNIIARISSPDSSAEECGATLSETPQSASRVPVCNESVVYFMPACRLSIFSRK